MYLESIDCGEDTPRQVVSGLVDFVPIDKMMGAKYVQLARTFRLLCALRACVLVP